MRPAGQVAAWLGFVVFAVFAALQFNDLDPVAWVAVYAATATCCAAFARGQLPWQVPAGLAAVASVWGLTLTPAVARAPFADVVDGQGMMAPGVEEVREMLGLFIVAAVLVVLTRSRRAATQWPT